MDSTYCSHLSGCSAILGIQNALKVVVNAIGRLCRLAPHFSSRRVINVSRQPASILPHPPT